MPNNKTHSILVVADAFGKPAYNPRLRSLCDYLTAQGWLVEVYTEQFEPLPFPHAYPITEIPVYTHRPLDWFFKMLATVLFDWKSRFFAKQLRRHIANKQYDLVLVSTFLPTPLRAAYEASQTHHIPLHIDLRDIDEQTPTNQYQAHRRWHLRMVEQLFRTINIRRRNKFLTKADSISSVSPWHVDFLHRWNTNVHLIYNGFDEQQFAPKNIQTDTFRIVYTGRIYDAALQDPSLFFRALQEMQQEGTLPTPMTVDWYTDEAGKARVMQMAKTTGTETLMHFHPFVPTDAVPDLLHLSSIVLVASRKSSDQGPHGIMTTKFFEALGVEKPVLCVPSDEECLAQVIAETNAGLAATTTAQIKTFLLEQYAKWQANGYTRQNTNPDTRQHFSRQYQARQFEQVLLSTLAARQQHYTLVDICWTLFYSNTTYDFLHIRGNRFNSLLYKLFRCDLIRSRAIRRFNRYTREQQQAQAEQFYTDYLLPRKITPVWKMIEGKEIILVSQTMDIIAETVARHIGAQTYHALPNKEDILRRYTDFDIITDNLSDIALIRQAKKATVITYNNRSRWEHLLPTNSNITYIETGREKY